MKTARRQRLSWIVCSWLVCQFALTLSSPLSMLRLSAAQLEQDCDCPVAPGEACPMHHGGTHDASTCHLRSALPGPEAAFFSQALALGILPASNAAADVLRPPLVLAPTGAAAIDREHLPDSPPPRA